MCQILCYELVQYTLSPINNLPYPNKENIATSLAAHCLYPTVFQKHPINRLQMVFSKSWLTSCPLKKGRGDFRAAGTADIVWAQAGERLITQDHYNQQVRVIISQSAGQGKMTLKYDHIAFLFTLLGHFPWIRVSIARKLFTFPQNVKYGKFIRQNTLIQQNYPIGQL